MTIPLSSLPPCVSEIETEGQKASQTSTPFIPSSGEIQNSGRIPSLLPQAQTQPLVQQEAPGSLQPAINTIPEQSQYRQFTPRRAVDVNKDPTTFFSKRQLPYHRPSQQQQFQLQQRQQIDGGSTRVSTLTYPMLHGSQPGPVYNFDACSSSTWPQGVPDCETPLSPISAQSAASVASSSSSYTSQRSMSSTPIRMSSNAAQFSTSFPVLLNPSVKRKAAFSDPSSSLAPRKRLSPSPEATSSQQTPGTGRAQAFVFIIAHEAFIAEQMAHPDNWPVLTALGKNRKHKRSKKDVYADITEKFSNRFTTQDCTVTLGENQMKNKVDNMYRIFKNELKRYDTTGNGNTPNGPTLNEETIGRCHYFFTLLNAGKPTTGNIKPRHFDENLSTVMSKPNAVSGPEAAALYGVDDDSLTDVDDGDITPPDGLIAMTRQTQHSQQKSKSNGGALGGLETLVDLLRQQSDQKNEILREHNAEQRMLMREQLERQRMTDEARLLLEQQRFAQERSKDDHEAILRQLDIKRREQELEEIRLKNMEREIALEEREMALKERRQNMRRMNNEENKELLLEQEMKLDGTGTVQSKVRARSQSKSPNRSPNNSP